MIVHHIGKCAAVQAVLRPEKRFQFFGGSMCISIIIYLPVQPYPFLNSGWIIKLFLSFNIIADHITNQNFGLIEGKICMGQVIHYYFNRSVFIQRVISCKVAGSKLSSNVSYSSTVHFLQC